MYTQENEIHVDCNIAVTHLNSVKRYIYIYSLLDSNENILKIKKHYMCEKRVVSM